MKSFLDFTRNFKFPQQFFIILNSTCFKRHPRTRWSFLISHILLLHSASHNHAWELREELNSSYASAEPTIRKIVSRAKFSRTLPPTGGGSCWRHYSTFQNFRVAFNIELLSLCDVFTRIENDSKNYPPLNDRIYQSFLFFIVYSFV